jgi:hypothetical protein
MSQSYKPVDRSEHGASASSSNFSIIDEDDEETKSTDDDNLSFDDIDGDGIELTRRDEDDVELARSKHGLTKKRTSQHQELESFQTSKGFLYPLYLIWETLTFAWIQPLLTKGAQKPLEKQDLLPLLPKDTPIAVFQRFKVAWKQQCDQFECPSLSMAFTIAVGRDFMIAGLIKLIHDSTLFVSPLLLNHIITFLTLYGNTTTTTTHRPSLSTGLFYVFALFVANLIQSLCLRQYFYLCFRTGMNLSHCHDHCYLSENSTGSLAKKSAGEVTNLMAVDSSRLQELTPYLHAIWYSLYQIVLAMTFLWQQMGISCLAGITVIVCMIPVSNRVSSYMKSLQKQLSKIRDDRSKLTNEMLLSMKVIKIQSWEAQFHKKINKIREEELVALGK